MPRYQWSERTVFVVPPRCRGIGDHLQFTRIPDAYRGRFGAKARFLVDDKYGIFSGLLAVEVVGALVDGDEPADLWNHGFSTTGTPVYRQLRLFMDDVEDDGQKPTLGRLPLFRKGERPCLCVTTQGKSSGKNLCSLVPEEVVREVVGALDERWVVVQVGGSDDRAVEGAVDRRGVSVQATYDILGAADAFLGVNSGMMHLANCVPSLPVMVYVESDVVLPIIDTGPDHPHHNWFYDDNVFIGDPAWLNVSSPEEAVRRMAEGVRRG